MTQFTDTDVRMLYAVAADMTRQGQVHAADDLRNLAERVRTQLPADAQLAREPIACAWLAANPQYGWQARFGSIDVDQLLRAGADRSPVLLYLPTQPKD